MGSSSAVRYPLSAVRCPLSLRRSLLGAFVVAILAVASLARVARADPLPYVSFSKAAWSAKENAGSVTITLTLSAASASPVTVNWATSDVTATGGGSQADYAPASGSVTFAPGQVTKDLPPITINDDAVYEGDETFKVTLTGASGATLGPNPGLEDPPHATVTIEDDELMPTVRFDRVSYQANEDEGYARIDVILTGESASTVTVGYSSADGTATSTGLAPDYVAVPANSTLAFAPGETRKAITVEIVLDSLPEGDERFFMALNAPSGAILGSPSTATVTISDYSSSIQVTATASDPTPAIT
ncbi:MAG: hypothetical protein K2W96_14395 [Gemmataceae bacterium]|nr:hypothetical protein [Gemmataceae bacterium]